MAKIGNFDANSVSPSQAFEPLPAGWYAMQIVDSEVKPAKQNPNNQYLQLTLEVIEGKHPDFKGRKVFERLNLWNTNEVAVGIAQRDLSAICRSVGVMTCEDSEQLHHRPIAVKIRIKPAQGDWDAQNEVKGYDAIAARFDGMQGATTTSPATQGLGSSPPPQEQPSGDAPTTEKPPWQK